MSLFWILGDRLLEFLLDNDNEISSSLDLRASDLFLLRWIDTEEADGEATPARTYRTPLPSLYE